MGGATGERARDARSSPCATVGHEVVLTHGNGPQVGTLMLQHAVGEPGPRPAAHALTR